MVTDNWDIAVAPIVPLNAISGDAESAPLQQPSPADCSARSLLSILAPPQKSVQPQCLEPTRFRQKPKFAVNADRRDSLHPAQQKR
jgi:hypothetical protein